VVYLPATRTTGSPAGSLIARGSSILLRFCANLTTLYPRMGLPDAMAAARADGFAAIECRTPFDQPAEMVREALDRLGLVMVQFNCPMGDFAGGERGLACLPGREADFRASIDETIAYATTLGVRQVNCISGLVPPGATLSQVEDVFVANLRHAAARLAEAGIRLQIEPINPIDTPGVFLHTTAGFARVAERVGHDNLYLQYDFYHMQVVQGDLIRTFDRFRDRINHVQIADNPGRHEPGSGEINYDFVLRELERRGYAGWVGLEYIPATTVREGLGWLERYRAGA
jgi:hydroxypyruvate isomerase